MSRSKNLEFQVKLNALKDLEDGIPIFQIARKLQVSESTVRGWKKSSTLESWKKQQFGVHWKERRRASRPRNERVDEAMWLWCYQKRVMKCSINGALLITQAQWFHQHLGGPTVGSKGWLQKWQERHIIRMQTNVDGASPHEDEAVNRFCEEFNGFVAEDNLTPDQVFNCSEFALNYKMLPKTTKSSEYKTDVSGTIDCQEKYTVMACCNASGLLKLPLVIIGKYAKPRAIKNLTNLPACYTHQANGWMTSDRFFEWFKYEFIPKVTEFLSKRNLPRKAILLTNQYISYPNNLSSGDITVIFFPQNPAVFLQPLHQDRCLEYLRKTYRKKLMERLIDRFDNGDSLADALKTVRVREVIWWLADAWNDVSMLTIQKSWYKVWPDLPTILSELGLNCADDTKLEVTDDKRRRELYGIEKTENEDEKLVKQMETFLKQLQANCPIKDIHLPHIEEWLDPPDGGVPEEFFTDDEIIEIVNLKPTNEDVETFVTSIQSEIEKKHEIFLPIKHEEHDVINDFDELLSTIKQEEQSIELHGPSEIFIPLRKNKRQKTKSNDRNEVYLPMDCDKEFLDETNPLDTSSSLVEVQKKLTQVIDYCRKNSSYTSEDIEALQRIENLMKTETNPEGKS